MKVFITSKTAFDDLMKRKGITNENVESHKKTFFISINDSCGTDEIPYFENKENVKVLFFDDVEKDLEVPIIGTKEVLVAKAFTSVQAKELLEFIESHKDKESCIVHCAAGISRSGAVGTFVNDFYGGDWFEFKKQNPYIHPNGLVLRLLKSAVAEKSNCKLMSRAICGVRSFLRKNRATRCRSILQIELLNEVPAGHFVLGIRLIARDIETKLGGSSLRREAFLSNVLQPYVSAGLIAQTLI